MNKRPRKLTVKKALDIVAKKSGVSVEAVRHDIEEVIIAARQSADPGIQAFWNAVPREGDNPTPEEVIAYIADALK